MLLDAVGFISLYMLLFSFLASFLEWYYQEYSITKYVITI